MLVFLAGCQTLQLDAPVRVQEGDWFTTGGGVERNAVVAQDVAPPLEQVWEYNALAAFGPGSPIVIGGAVLVANLQGEVHAVNLENGKRLGNISFRGEAIAAQPALLGTHMIIANAWGKRTLQAYHLERATKLWHQDGPRVEAGLLPVGDSVVVADMDGRVRMLTKQSGREEWLFQDPDAASVRATPLLATELVLVAR